MLLRLFTVAIILSSAGVAFAQQVTPITLGPQDPGVTELGEIVVEASPVEQTARAFVASVGAPPPGRDLAAWRTSICVGAAGIRGEPAQYLVDRVSDWGPSLGLRIGEPGCRPDVIIVVSDNADDAARELVNARPREFRTGVSGSDRGAAALEAFQNSGEPIRWWHVSLPVDEDTGDPVGRLPGETPPDLTRREMVRPLDLGSAGMSVMASRLSDQTRDDLQQVVIIVDVAAFERAGLSQIADYVSMVSLAQIDPETSPPVGSILHLFEPGTIPEDSLSRWDRAFLRALYSVDQRRSTRNANLSAIAAAMGRELQDGE
jgi:hypothetical protein